MVYLPADRRRRPKHVGGTHDSGDVIGTTMFAVGGEKRRGQRGRSLFDELWLERLAP